MSHPVLARFIVTAISCLAVGCAGESPVSPSALSGGDDTLNAKPGAALPGVYELSFYRYTSGVLVPVSSLPVLTNELIIAARVTDSSGSPALAGTVTFEYCSYKGGPPNDIARADEAPKEACETGSASWARLQALTVTATGSCPGLGAGYTCMNFGIVRIPRDVGFRFKFASQRSGIASGVSAHLNFTWTP